MCNMISTELDTRTRILAETCRLMEEKQGQGVRVSDIAHAVGISRQAVYLHFGSRTELLIAAVRYADQVRGRDERLRRLCASTGGLAILEALIDFWVKYIPEIYGLAKALLQVRDTDEAAAAAWNDRMADLRSGCSAAIECLRCDGLLVDDWPPEKAVDVLMSLISIRVWEYLVVESGWSQVECIDAMHTAAKRTLVRST